jgi:hypothetical protein
MKLISVNLACSILTVGLTLGFCRPCFADEAQDLYQKGVQQFKKDEYDSASRSFKAAYKLKPTWKLYYNIGQCEAAAKRYGTALESFEAFLAEGGDDISPDRREEVLAEMQRLRQMVGSLTVVAPDDALVFIDGIERGKAPIIGKLLETAGRQHEIWFVKDDRKSEVKLFKINVEESLEIRFDALAAPTVDSSQPLESTGSAPPPTEPAADNPPSKPVVNPAGPTAVRPPAFVGWITVGIGAAAVAAGSVMGGLTLGSKKDIDSSNNCVDQSCTSDQSTKIAQMKQQGLAADILLFSGGAATVVGIVLLAVHVKRSKNDMTESPKVSLSPALCPDFTGMSLEGRF